MLPSTAGLERLEAGRAGSADGSRLFLVDLAQIVELGLGGDQDVFGGGGVDHRGDGKPVDDDVGVSVHGFADAEARVGLVGDVEVSAVTLGGHVNAQGRMGGDGRGEFGVEGDLGAAVDEADRAGEDGLGGGAGEACQDHWGVIAGEVPDADVVAEAMT